MSSSVVDNIKVAVRLRPYSKREIELGTTQTVVINNNQIILNHKDSNKNPKNFTFDNCFDSSTTDKPDFADQEIVYQKLGTDILENSLAGYNACIFAYGQTGSGKSWTMMGGADKNKGLIPRLCEALFEHINNGDDENKASFRVEVSYMEIYNEKVRDLLDPTGSKQNLKVREHKLLGPYVDGLSQLAVSSYQDIEVILNEGNKSRTVAATNMNSESSRSHAVFVLKILQTIVDNKSGISGEKVSRLSLVDLAGSEKVSKTGVEGERLKEGCNINKSLLTLGQVISSLADNSSNAGGKNKAKYVPYRDSVLTWLLKDSIGGNSKTVMISTISPSFDNYEETLSTLRYADRAKRIVNNAVVNEDPNAKIIRELREELETLRKELEKAKEQINADALKDKLQESEKLYNEMSKPWNEKLAETEKIQQEWNDTLQCMGISVESSGIKVEKDKYYLVNLNADPSMNELLVYYLKDWTLVGRRDAANKQDIQLEGPGIAAEHCAFYMKNNHVCVAPCKDANTWVNGKSIHGETILYHGDRIVLGINHFFRLNCPTDEAASINNIKQSKSDTEFNMAQEEVILQSNKLKSEPASENDSLNLDEENKSILSSHSSSSTDDSGLVLELAIQKLEQDFSSMNTSRTSSTKIAKPEDDTTSLWFRKGLKLLRGKLLRTNSLVREANSLCKEISLATRFSVTLQIPAYNLTPHRNKNSILCEPAVVIKPIAKPNSTKVIINLEQFENYVVQIREMYEKVKKNSESGDENQQNLAKFFHQDNINYKYKLIGVANLFLDSLMIDDHVMFEYFVPVISQQGEIVGKLKVRLQRLPNETETDSSELHSLNSESSSHLRFRLSIIEARELTLGNMSNLLYCKYQFWSQPEATMIQSLDNSTNEKSVVRFNYEHEFNVELTEDFLEYCQEDALSIALLNDRFQLRPSQQKALIKSSHMEQQLDSLDQLARFQSLVDSWSEVSKSYELSVQILELNTEGHWKPVQVNNSEHAATGGVYRLKQGQSRKIRVTLLPTKPGSVMSYNGSLFTILPHRIDKVLIGCIEARDTISIPLDSYQEADLTRLRTRWSEILEKRKQFLQEQLGELTSGSDEEKELSESMMKQLTDLGAEQVTIDAPSDNSHLPGSTIQWQPENGMEQHVPIIFIDLDNSRQQQESNIDQERKQIETYSHDSYLKSETAGSYFIDLKIVSCNDSSKVKIVANKSDDDFEDDDELTSNEDSLKAVASWDSSEHQSMYLNQITPVDKLVYLTLKIFVKCKLKSVASGDAQGLGKQFINVVLRKRICVNVGLNSSLNTPTKMISLNRFKSILGSNVIGNMRPKASSPSTTQNTKTSVTYRMISSIPRVLTEIENRENLASRAAYSITQSLMSELNDSDGHQSKQESSPTVEYKSLDTSTVHLENYAKMCLMVDSILKKDREEQLAALEKIVSSKNTENGQEVESRSGRKALNGSIRHSLSNLKNSPISQAKQLKADQKVNDTSDHMDITLEFDKSFHDGKLKEETKPAVSSGTVSKASIEIFQLYESVAKNEKKEEPKIDKEEEAKIADLIFQDLGFEESKPSLPDVVVTSSTEKEEAPSSLSDSNTNLNLTTSLNRAESNHSIASTLTNTSQKIVENVIDSKSKLDEQDEIAEQIESLPEWLKLNAHVIVSTNTVQNKRGYVRYVGGVKFGTGLWIGVELEQKSGKNDGSVKGVRYFTCPEEKGVFVRADKLTPIVNRE